MENGKIPAVRIPTTSIYQVNKYAAKGWGIQDISAATSLTRSEVKRVINAGSKRNVNDAEWNRLYGLRDVAMREMYSALCIKDFPERQKKVIAVRGNYSDAVPEWDLRLPGPSLVQRSLEALKREHKLSKCIDESRQARGLSKLRRDGRDHRET